MTDTNQYQTPPTTPSLGPIPSLVDLSPMYLLPSMQMPDIKRAYNEEKICGGLRKVASLRTPEHLAFMANSTGRDFHGTLFARHAFDASFAKENLGFNNRQLIAMKFPVDQLKALGMTDEEIKQMLLGG